MLPAHAAPTLMFKQGHERDDDAAGWHERQGLSMLHVRRH